MNENIVRKTVEYLSEHPEHTENFKRLIEVEAEGERREYYFGWEWFDAGIPTARLNKLVTLGIIKVRDKTSKRTSYGFVDREAIQEAVRLFEAKPEPEPERPPPLPPDLFEPIVGYEDVKQHLRRGLEAERPVHFLFIGPPSTAKTLFTMEIARLENARYALGSTSSKAGIAEFLLQNRPRYLIIDEIDKMNMVDYSILLSLMQTGVVTRLKKGMTEAVEMKTWVFGAANFDDRIPPELMSRFGKIYLHEYSREDFIRVAVNILSKRENTDPLLAQYIAEKLASSTRDVRDAIRLARLGRSREEVDEALKIMEKYGKK